MLTNEAKERARELGVRVARLEYLDSFLKKAVEDDIHPSIAIKIALKGVEIFSGAYGVASPGGPPLEIDMISDTQSVTKPVTATLVMMLQEDGLLEVRDSVQKFFPEFIGPGKDEVQLWHLLTHTSGMTIELFNEYRWDFLKKLLAGNMPPENADGEIWDSAINAVRERLGASPEEIEKESSSDYLDRMALSAPLKNPPRSRFCYCNVGYKMLAKLCERLTGKSLPTLAEERIFAPLGMTDSHFVLPKEKWPRVMLRGDDCRGSEWLNSEKNRTYYAGNVGLKSTVGDMLRFGQMFLNNGSLDGADILSPASVRAMTKNYNTGIPRELWRGHWYDSNWGFGWNIRDGKFDDLGVLRSDRTYDHAGYGGWRLFCDPENMLTYASCLVDKNDDDYILQAKVTNIIYSALAL